MSEFKLFREIGKLSTTPKWDFAKQEWDLNRIYEIPEGEDSEQCLCGHYPIREVCELVNRLNQKVVEVGNHCVNKFFEIPSESIFVGVKRVRKDITKSFSAEAITYAFEKGFITQWQYGFYMDIKGKRKLTESQMRKKMEANRAILRKLDLQSID